MNRYRCFDTSLTDGPDMCGPDHVCTDYNAFCCDCRCHDLEDCGCECCEANSDKSYCDDCGEPVKPHEMVVISRLATPVASANAGESAIICKPCYAEYKKEMSPDVLDHHVEGTVGHFDRYVAGDK